MTNHAEVKRIRLILLERPALMRASLAQFLAAQPDLEVIGEFDTPSEALAVMKDAAVDVVLLDPDALPDDGDDFMCLAREAGYHGWFLVLTGAPDVRKAAQAIRLGASGVFLISDVPDHLIRAIRFVANGDAWVDSTILRSLATQLICKQPPVALGKPATPLDDRERKIVALIVAGLSNQAIADRTGLPLGTVKNVVQRLFDKTRARTRSLLVRRVLEGFLGDPSRLLLEPSATKP